MNSDRRKRIILLCPRDKKQWRTMEEGTELGQERAGEALGQVQTPPCL